MTTRSTHSANPVVVVNGAKILTLTIDATEPSSLLIFGAAGCRSSAPVRLQVLIDGVAAGPAFRSDFVDATVPIALHARTETTVGRHLVEVTVEATEPVTIEDRILTALVYREKE